MKKCPYCSNPINNSAKRCMFCGRNLDFELAKKLEKEKADREQLYKTTKVALLTIAIIAIVSVATVWAAVDSPIGSKAKQAATQTAVALSYCNPQEVSIAARQLIDLNDRWADIMALAVSVDRSVVVLHVDRLQKIRRDAKDVETPDCLKSAKLSLIDGMDVHIDGLLAYMREKPLEEVNNSITAGNLAMNSFADDVERLQKCAPNCR